MVRQMQQQSNQKESSNSEGSDEEEQSERSSSRGIHSSHDFNQQYINWKKKNGILVNLPTGYELYDKIYIVKGGYHDLRESLEDRGWVENPDVFSPFFDIKWTTKLYDIDYQNLEEWQIVNHFDKNQCLTSKYGLTKTIRSVFWNEGIDSDLFYPRCYDLADLTDFEDWIEDYKFTKVSVLWVILDRILLGQVQLPLRA